MDIALPKHLCMDLLCHGCVLGLQVIYFLLGIVGGLLRLWSINIMKQHFTFSVGIVKDHKCVAVKVLLWSH